MEDFLNSSGLGFLIGMVLVTGTLCVGYVVYFITRRGKKSKMKHGLLRSSKAEVKEVANSEEASSDELNINTNVLSEEIAKPDKASANVLSNPIPATPPPSKNQVSTSIEDKLNLGLLGKSIEPEIAMENTSKPADQKPVDLAARLGPSPIDSTPPRQATEPVELLRLLRDPQSGQFIVEVAGQHYAKLASVTDKKVGQYILKLTAHLLAFTNGVIITGAGMKSIHYPKDLKEVPMPLGPSRTSAPQPPAPPQKMKPDRAERPPSPKPLPQPEPPSLGSLQLPPTPPPQPSGLLGRVAQPPPPPASLPGLNLAEEINDIVQARLRYSPLAANTQVEITSDYHGGIRIEVNNQFYSSPDEVPDPDVKELIKASIKEWERR